MITERPDGIIITIPVKFFKEYPGGLKGFIRVIELIGAGELQSWGNTISNIPKHEVLYCYLLFNRKVQYRMNIASYERNVTRSYNDGGIIREFTCKNWVDLTGPLVKAPVEIPMKGFQGFRYTTKLF